MKYKVLVWDESQNLDEELSVYEFDTVEEAISDAKSYTHNSYNGYTIEVVEIDDDNEFTNNFIYNKVIDCNEITNEMLLTVQNELEKKYRCSNAKYFDIDLKNGKTLQLRVADHTHNLTNLSKCESDYFASVVISNIDFTEKKFNGINELEFNSDNTIVEILEQIENLIKKYSE